MTTWPTGVEAARLIRQETDTALLSFSCGKDAITTWLVLQPIFPRIIPFHCYLVPGLEFEEESLARYEKHFGTRILRVPHPALYRMLREGVFQPPERMAVIWPARLPVLTFELMRDDICEDFGLSPNHMMAVGMRTADNPLRGTMFQRYGPINRNRGKFFPIYDMRKAELVERIRTSGCKLPKEYRFLGRSFDGINFQYLWGIRKYFPADWQRILDWFPLAELEFKRHEYPQEARLRSCPAEARKEKTNGRQDDGKEDAEESARRA